MILQHLLILLILFNFGYAHVIDEPERGALYLFEFPDPSPKGYVQLLNEYSSGVPRDNVGKSAVVMVPNRELIKALSRKAKKWN